MLTSLAYSRNLGQSENIYNIVFIYMFIVASFCFRQIAKLFVQETSIEDNFLSRNILPDFFLKSCLVLSALNKNPVLIFILFLLQKDNLPKIV